MFKQFGVIHNEIYLEDFLQLALLKRSTKGATISFFRKKPCSEASISRDRAKLK